MTKETEVEVAAEPVLASRDLEEVEKVEEDDGIVEDVIIDPPEDYEDSIRSSEDPRAHIYAHFNEKRDKEIQGENDEITGENTELAPENTESDVETAEDEAIIEPTPQEATHPDASEMVEVKILGDVRSVPKDKIDAAGGIENYQIRIAAQEQMERNAHERQALEARQQALDERERQMAATTAAIPAMDSQSSQTPDRSTPTDGQNLEEMARQYQEAVYDDASEAPSILAGMVRAAAATGESFDKDAFRQQIKEDVLSEQRQAKIVKAGQILIDGHPELNMRDPKFDPRMYKNIDDETMVVDREHPEWEPDQIVQEAYDRISKWKGNTPPQPKTMSDKQAAKRVMTRPRTGTQRYQPPAEPPRPTRSDYVAEQRKARGLE